MAGWHHHGHGEDWMALLMDMSLSKLQKTVKGREAWHAAVHGVAMSDLATEQQQPSAVGRAVCLAEFPGSNVNLIWKHAHRHIQKQGLAKYLGTLSPSQVDTKLTITINNIFKHQ